MRGSKDSFVESLTMNAALLRRRIRSRDLHIEYFNIGRVSKTDVAVCYLDDRVNKKHLDTLKKKDTFDKDRRSYDESAIACRPADEAHMA